jgi:hypothetical protein
MRRDGHQEHGHAQDTSMRLAPATINRRLPGSTFLSLVEERLIHPQLQLKRLSQREPSPFPFRCRRHLLLSRSIVYSSSHSLGVLLAHHAHFGKLPRRHFDKWTLPRIIFIVFGTSTVGFLS